ncbi:hypothetical protein FB645_003923 [Coemansia sp. IMI 203386]|nr:hypothetical protein FB645_003923 [Coemansia sp. IMI 203386]
MDVFPTHIVDPSMDNCPSSNNSTNGRDLLVAASAAQETAIHVATTIIQQQQEVVARLSRYRNYYEMEIARQNERMADIERAMKTFGQQGEASDSKQRALKVLAASLDDARKTLFDARLAKARLELEISHWVTHATGAAAAGADSTNN